MGLSKLLLCHKRGRPKPEPATQQQVPSKQKHDTVTNRPPKIPSIPKVPNNGDNGAKVPEQDTAPNVQDDPPKAQETSTMSTSQRVWNRAYDELASDDGTKKLVEAYNKIIKKTSKPDDDASESEVDEDVTEMDDANHREKAMRAALESGQKRIYKSTKINEAVGSVSNFVFKVKDAVDFAVGNIPQAALPWAGVCLGLTFLLNPANASKANLDGLGYVISRMEWYCSLTEHLLSTDYLEVGNNGSFKGVLNQLEGRVVDLYKALLFYQMKSVCSYYTNQGWVFVRNLINSDDWDGQLEGVKEAEGAVRDGSRDYQSAEGQRRMRELVQTAEGTQEILGSFHQTMQDYIAEQRSKYQDDELGRCLSDLYVVDPQGQMATIQGKKKDKLLPEAYNWILRTKEYQALADWSGESTCQVLWLHGPAGTGKTMLNIGIISEILAQSSSLAPSISYYFCQADEPNTNSAMDVLRSLIRLLLIQQPHLFSHLRDSHKSANATMFNSSNFFRVCDIFKAMLADERLTSVYLVIDALDECADGEPGAQDLISLVSDSLEITANANKIKWILSSRPEIDVVNRLSDDKTAAVVELDVQAQDEAVDAYITHKLSQLQHELRYPKHILDAVGAEIRSRAQNTFLWAALVFKYLLKERVPQFKALAEVKKNPSDLSKLYHRMMDRIDEGDDENDKALCKSALEAACFAYRPLSYAEIHVLSGLPSEYPPEYIVQKCGSFLSVQNTTVHLLHNSTRQFLTKYFKERVAMIHEAMFHRSITAMSEDLRFNMYDIQPATELTDITVPENDPLSRLGYSCEFWVYHLCKSEAQLSDNGSGSVLVFLQAHFLHWLESLSLIHKLSRAIVAIRNLQEKIKSASTVNPELVAFLDDSERFTMKNLTVMTAVPLQIYGSALLFSPMKSDTRIMSWDQRYPSIGRMTGVGDHWDPCRQTLDAGEKTKALAFSPNDKNFATGLISDGSVIVKLWDAAIGVCIRLFEFNDSEADHVSVAFASDSKTLAVASSDKFRLIDIDTGAHRDEFKLPGCAIKSIAFSEDGKSFALGLDGAVQLWDVSNWTRRWTSEEHTGFINSIAFATDSKCLATGSADQTARLWDPTNGTCTQVLKHFYEVDTVFFSPDGNSIVSIAYYMNIWDVSTGAIKNKHDQPFADGGAFSADGKVIATSRRIFGTLNLWDAATGDHIQTFDQGSELTCLAFSKCTGILVSSSPGGLVRIWEVTGLTKNVSTAHDKVADPLSFSEDGKMLATGSKDNTVKLWDPSDGRLLHTLEGHGGDINLLAFSSDGKLLASLSRDCTVRIWDTATGVGRHTLECFAVGNQEKMLEKMILANAGLLGFDLDGDDEDRISGDNDDGDDEDNDERFPTEPQLARFSPDGRILAADAGYGRVLLWDVASGECKQELQGVPTLLQWLWFSQDGKTLAAGGIAGVEFWDLDTGECKRTVKDFASAMCLSSDGKTLVSCSEEKTLRVRDAATGDIKQTVDVGYEVRDLSFIDNDKYLRADHNTFAFTSGVLATLPDPDLLRSAVWFDDTWVIRGGKKLFSLPPDYSRHRAASYQNTLALGSITGRVAILQFVNG